MSAPPLPEIFGNYALGDFVEVVPPAAVSWWPQTAGWWWLGGALLLWALYRAWHRLRRWYRNRYRREAIAQLRLLAGMGADTPVSEINRLLKLTALAAYSREQVARLSGQEWADFLNRHCPGAPFSAAQGQLLAAAPYTGQSAAGDTGRQLVAASIRWVLQHEAPQDD